MAEKKVWVEGGNLTAVAGPMQYIGQGESRIWIEGGNIAITGGGGGGLDYQGNYSNATAYTTGQVVTYNGSLYQALQNTTGNAPPNNDGGVYTTAQQFTPEIPINSDAGNIEVGFQFWVDQACTLTAGLFYKGDATNGGTHVIRLWDAATATQITSTTVTGETASGWQRQAFSSPPSLTPWKRYIFSYSDPQGHYSNTEQFFGGGHYIDGPVRWEMGMFNSTSGNIPNTPFKDIFYFSAVEVTVAANANWKLLAKGDWGTA